MVFPRRALYSFDSIESRLGLDMISKLSQVVSEMRSMGYLKIFKLKMLPVAV